ncbi:MAG: ubiquinone/menaquinone biosynthesis methyltransferase [Dehalococcoidia bacterium]|nr:ubiquinone/menaquinone biosynthesis methyltransferase [Dehalococcoidia bacterium]
MNKDFDLPETGRTTSAPPSSPLVSMRNMFDRLSPFYDRVNKIISLNRDDYWRRKAAALCGGPARGIALDVATGTGRMALALSARYENVVGVDISDKMMAGGREAMQRLPGFSRMNFILADALVAPFPDNTFDAVAIGFATRNVVDLRGCFREMLRLVKPGGTIVCLELSRPPLKFVDAPYQFYLAKIVPLLGKVFSGQSRTYKYIFHSLQKFPPAGALKQLMEETGLREVKFRRFNLGAVAVHWGTK